MARLHGRPLDDNGGIEFTKPAPLDMSDLQPVLDAIIYDAGMTIEGKVDSIVKLVRDELVRAMIKHPPITDSPHHHWGVIAEEFDELWDEVKADNIRLAREEALQLAAMAIRFVLEADLIPHRRRPNETPAPRATCKACGAHEPHHWAWCEGTLGGPT